MAAQNAGLAKMAKPGSDYERLALEVFQSLIGIPGATFRHDVSLEGRSGTHQIDVLGDLLLGGMTFRILIQAKDWMKPVDQGEVLKFQAVLADIAGQPRGVMVSRSGFQAGARDIAQSHGILLYELRQAADADAPEGRIIFDIDAYARKIDCIEPIPDHEWMRAEARRLELPRGQTVRIEVQGKLTDIFLFQDGNAITTVMDVIASTFPKAPGPLERLEREIALERPLMLQTNAPCPFPRIQVTGFKASTWTEKMSFRGELTVSPIAAWLLTEMREGSKTVFDPQHRRIEPPTEERIHSVQWVLDPTYGPWSGQPARGELRTPNGWNALCLFCPPGHQRKTMGRADKAVARADAEECLQKGHRVLLEHYWDDEVGVQHVEQERI